MRMLMERGLDRLGSSEWSIGAVRKGCRGRDRVARARVCVFAEGWALSAGRALSLQLYGTCVVKSAWYNWDIVRCASVLE